VSAALVLCALWLVNLAAFHSWASWGPPSLWPEWHRAWSYRFALLSLLCVVLAGLTIWALRARRITSTDAPRDPA
jgi:hypothetical protein